MRGGGNLGWEFRFWIPISGTTGIRNSASEFGIPEFSGGKSNRKTRKPFKSKIGIPVPIFRNSGIPLITYIGTLYILIL